MACYLAGIIADRANLTVPYQLITLDIDDIMGYARANGVPVTGDHELDGHPGIIKLIDGEIAKVNARLASFESIKRYTIVPEFTIDDGTATPTLKLKKHIIIEKFKKIIDAMYEA